MAHNKYILSGNSNGNRLSYTDKILDIMKNIGRLLVMNLQNQLLHQRAFTLSNIIHTKSIYNPLEEVHTAIPYQDGLKNKVFLQARTYCIWPLPSSICRLFKIQDCRLKPYLSIEIRFFHIRCTVKKKLGYSWICFDQTFLGPGLGKLFPVRDSLVSDILAGKTAKPFFKV